MLDAPRGLVAVHDGKYARGWWLCTSELFFRRGLAAPPPARRPGDWWQCTTGANTASTGVVLAPMVASTGASTA